MVPWLAANLWLGACTWTSGGRPARCAGYPASLSTELLLTTGTELLLTTGTEWRPAPRPPRPPPLPRPPRAPPGGAAPPCRREVGRVSIDTRHTAPAGPCII